MQSYQFTPDVPDSALASGTHLVKRLADEIKKAVIGNDQLIDFIILGLLCNGHVLLEGVPGVGKTLLVKALTKAVGLSFKRIQFTPDLLPSDLIGTIIFNAKTHDFETKKGPIFANLILADEINRAPAKVQAALLEAMQEQQVTIGSTSFILDKPFIVFATQNPFEQEGTYQLPEAQIDRFMLKLIMHYPTAEQEKSIIAQQNALETISTIITPQELSCQQNNVNTIYTDPKIIDYIVTIVSALRKPTDYGFAWLAPLLVGGVSSRATLALHKASQAYAYIKQRNFVIPDDVKAVAYPVLRHRVVLSYEAQAQDINPEQLISSLLQKIVCP